MIAKSSFFYTVLTMAGHKEVIPIAFVSIEQDANFFGQLLPISYKQLMITIKKVEG